MSRSCGSWRQNRQAAFDICNNVAIRSAEGSTEQLTYDFSGHLGSAQVQAVVPVLDTVCSCSYDIAVDMSRTGQGDIVSDREHMNEWLLPGMRIITNFNGSIRRAVELGSLITTGSLVTGARIIGACYRQQLVFRETNRKPDGRIKSLLSVCRPEH